MGKINIVLSCSQQAWNKCLLCESEEAHTYLIASKVAEILKGYNANVCLIPKDITGTESETLTKVVNASNDFIRVNGGKGFHLDIHTDGGYAGSGSSGFFVSEGGKAFIMQIHKQVSALTPFLDGIVAYRSLYVLNNTIATAGLIEVAFHDKPNEAKWIHDNIDNIAKAIVRGMEATTGIVKVEQEHWAKPYYDFLNQKGLNVSEERFDEAMTRGEVFALVSKVYGHLNK